ncbi:hypothetical protein LSH36_96g01017 [Paralvinella palmiformis]|uniref:RRM domain-containing protein n=1 Tax=Paralvinella palmiformis TaxID=53620 RepID=A0AAD9K0A0_9ANNE|nr:hypothetical protein LSH36_96g01017 [Paralvinella palmiformis]
MSYGDSESELQELRRKNLYLEAENKQLKEELEQVKIQLGQFKSVNESQQSALKDKDSLLEQLKEVNESLQNDLKALKEIKPKSAPVPAFPGAGINPWADSQSVTPGNEPEQYRKLFVGGLNYDTTQESLQEYFEQFGEVQRSAIIYDSKQQSRGFGFIIYKTAAMVDAAQAARPHVVDGRSVDTKRALPKEDTDKPENAARVRKLFVGGFSRDTEDQHLRDYFSVFGNVESVDMLVFKDTGRKRGFAFVYFDDYDPVDKLVLIKHHVINGCLCEVKKAVARDEMNRRNMGFSSGGGSSRNGKSSSSTGYRGGPPSGSNISPNMPGPFPPSNASSFGGGGGQSNFGGNQSNFDSNKGGNFGGNRGGNFGGNSGDYSSGSQGGNFGGNRGGGGDDYSSSNTGNCPPVPPEMAMMWSAFCSQYMSSMGSGDGGGPMRTSNSHPHRSSGPYSANNPRSASDPGHGGNAYSCKPGSDNMDQ